MLKATLLNVFPQVSAFSTWEKELHKIVFDPRYLLLNSEERKQVRREVRAGLRDPAFSGHAARGTRHPEVPRCRRGRREDGLWACEPHALRVQGTWSLLSVSRPLVTCETGTHVQRWKRNFGSTAPPR